MQSSALTRRNFLLASAAAASLSPTARAATKGGAPDHLIVCLARGGWDTTYALDPKPDSKYMDGPQETFENEEDVEYILELNDNQRVQCNEFKRPGVTRFFENWGHRTAVINGQYVGSITHDPCRLRILTGSTRVDGPDFATIFGFEWGRDLPLGSIDLSAVSYPGPLAATTGRIGFHNQLRALLDPTSFFDPPADSEVTLPLRRLAQGERDLIRDYMERRAEGYRALRGEGGANDRHLDDFLVSIDRRDRLLAAGQEITGDLVIGEDPSTEQQAKLAVELLTKGLCRSITLKDQGNWDTHKINKDQHGLHDKFFSAVDGLIADLEANQLLDRTLVVVCSEMARTPRLNADKGKDHWGHTTQLLVGGGVRGGHTYGATDDLGESMLVDLNSGDVTAKGQRVKYDNTVAGILAHLDVDPEKWLPGIIPFTACTV